MNLPKEVSHYLYSGRIRSSLLYSERLRRIWFIERNRFSYSNYSIEEITDMGFRLVKLKPITLENK